MFCFFCCFFFFILSRKFVFVSQKYIEEYNNSLPIQLKHYECMHTRMLTKTKTHITPNPSEIYLTKEGIFSFQE